MRNICTNITYTSVINHNNKKHFFIMQYEILIASASSSSSYTNMSPALIIFDMSTNMFYLNAEISASALSIIIMWVPPAPQPVLVVNLRDDVTPCETIFVNTCKDNRSEEISSKSESTFLWSKKNTLQIKVCSSENGGCFCRTGGWSWSWSWFWS